MCFHGIWAEHQLLHTVTSQAYPLYPALPNHTTAVIHSVESVICLLSHTWAHRCSQVTNVTVGDRGERVCHHSSPKSMASFACKTSGHRWLWHCQHWNLRSPSDWQTIFFCPIGDPCDTINSIPLSTISSECMWLGRGQLIYISPKLSCASSVTSISYYDKSVVFLPLVYTLTVCLNPVHWFWSHVLVGHTVFFIIPCINKRKVNVLSKLSKREFVHPGKKQIWRTQNSNITRVSSVCWWELNVNSTPIII